MRVLGIDPGCETTGWGVVDGNARHYQLLEFGAIRTKASQTFPARLAHISREIEEVISRHNPDACALEDGFLATNVKVTLKLGQVRGVAMLAAERAALGIANRVVMSVLSAGADVRRDRRRRRCGGLRHRVMRHFLCRIVALPIAVPSLPSCLQAARSRRSGLSTRIWRSTRPRRWAQCRSRSKKCDPISCWRPATSGSSARTASAFSIYPSNGATPGRWTRAGSRGAMPRTSRRW